MMKHNRKTMAFLLCGVLFALVMSDSLHAQEQKNVVTGKTYAMYFLTLLNNNPDFDDASLSHMHVTFKEDGGVAVEMIDGHGLHLAVPGLFAATYFAVGVHMGFETMDVFTAMTGISIDPLVTGVGFFLVDYTRIEPYVFTGFQLVDSTM